MFGKLPGKGIGRPYVFCNVFVRACVQILLLIFNEFKRP